MLRDYYPLIEGLNADLIQRARSLIKSRGVGSPKSNSGKNLLASLARCGACGGFMVMRNRSEKDGPYAYLQCDNAAKHKSCAAKGMFNYRLLEPAILDTVLHLTLDDAFFSMADQTVSLRIQIAEHDRQAAAAKEERDNTRALLRRYPDDEELNEDWQKLSMQVKTLEAERESLATQMTIASGKISAAEHLARVHNFRAALYEDDVEVRRTARLRVREAFRAVISHVTCDQTPDEKWVDVALVGGLVGFRFDNKGVIQQKFDFRDSPDHVRGLTSGVLADNAKLVEAVMSR